MAEVRARGDGSTCWPATSSGSTPTATHLIRVRESGDVLSPIVNVIPLQLLAYHVGCARAPDVDKPRNPRNR